MTFRVTASGALPGGEEWVNVFHFGGTVLAEDQVLDDAFSAVQGFYDDFNDRLHIGWELTRLSGANVGGPTIREDEVTGLAGEVSGTPLPNDMSILVHWLTANPARTARGRSFLGGWPINAVALGGTSGPGVVDGGPAGGVAAAALTLVDTPGVAFVVHSRTLGSDATITGGQVSRRWSTQRRRDLETPRLLVTF